MFVIRLLKTEVIMPKTNSEKVKTSLADFIGDAAIVGMVALGVIAWVAL